MYFISPDHRGQIFMWSILHLQWCIKYTDPQVQVQVQVPKPQVRVQVQVPRPQVQVQVQVLILQVQVQVQVPNLYCKYMSSTQVAQLTITNSILVSKNIANNNYAYQFFVTITFYDMLKQICIPRIIDLLNCLVYFMLSQ